ncbi:MAG: hypothetical protein HY886_03580 [Deltaproteobacteria bacterium]|nr:hypothetical protein [Deltaproteobacteria bacterium]
MKRAFYTILAILTMFAAGLLTSFVAAAANEPPVSENEQKIVERIIQIEGTIEKPRVLFILPRARVWRPGVLHRNHLPDVMEPKLPALKPGDEIGITDTQQRR